SSEPPRGRSTYTSTSAEWLADSSRARCSVLLTTPVRLRSRSRPSNPTRGTCEHLVENACQLTRQMAPIEPGHVSRPGQKLPIALGVRLAQHTRDRVGRAR